MLEKIRDLLRQYRHSEPDAFVFVLTDYIPVLESLQSLLPEELVDVFFAERTDAYLALQAYIEELNRDYSGKRESYERENLTPEDLQRYINAVQLSTQQRSYYQFDQFVGSAMEANIPPARQIEDFAPIVAEEISEYTKTQGIQSLFRQASVFRKLIEAGITAGVHPKETGTERKETMLATSQELLDGIPDDAFRTALQDPLGFDEGTALLISRYLRKRLEDVLRCPSRYRIHGLFTSRGKGGEIQGFVRDVYVEIWQEGTGKFSYGVELVDDCKHRKDFKRSAYLGREAAIALIRKWYPSVEDPSHYDIRLHIEDIGAAAPYGGGSIGLAVALGIIAQCTEQVIGVQQIGDLAVTGEISDRNGSITKVEDIDCKTKAIIELNRQSVKMGPIKYLFVPEVNEKEAYEANRKYDGNLEIRAFGNLESLIKEGILFDPFRQYLEAVSQEEQTAVAISDEVWSRIREVHSKPTAVLGRFFDDKGPIARALAARFAQERSRSETRTNDVPIPVVMDASVFSHSDQLSDLIFRQFGASSSAPLDGGMTRKSLRTGRFALIITGLDTSDDIPFFKPGAAMDEYRKFYSQSRILFVCTESSWRKYRRRIAGSDPWHVVPLYKGRSTFLDKRIEEVTDPIIGIARKTILACVKQGGVSPKEFFYGKRPGRPHYIDLQVRRLDRSDREDESDMVGPRFLSEVIAEGRDRHILLLADGGAGKTTLLLKLFFDCLEGICKLSTPHTKDCWSQFITPFFYSLGRLSSSHKTIYEIFQDSPNSSVESELELELTDNILIILDGLDRATSEIRERDVDFANDLHRFLDNMDESNPNHWVILSCRKQEEIREVRSLVRLIEKAEARNYFVKYEILDLSLEDAEDYLRKVVPQSAERLMEALGQRQRDIMRNPMLLYLFSTLDPDGITEIERAEKRPLNRSLIYRMAMDQWLEMQLKGRKVFRIFSQRKTYNEAPRELLRILAKEMVDRGEFHISEEGAVEIFNKVKEQDSPEWWPRDKEGKLAAAQEVLDELVVGGLLKVSG